MLSRKFFLFAIIELLREKNNYKQSFLMLMAIQTWHVDRQWEKLPCRSTSGRDRSKTTCGRLVWPYPRRHDDHLCLRGPEIFLCIRPTLSGGSLARWRFKKYIFTWQKVLRLEMSVGIVTNLGWPFSSWHVSLRNSGSHTAIKWGRNLIKKSIARFHTWVRQIPDYRRNPRI